MTTKAKKIERFESHFRRARANANEAGVKKSDLKAAIAKVRQQGKVKSK